MNTKRELLPDIWHGGMLSPFRSFQRLQRQMDRMFDEFLQPLNSESPAEAESFSYALPCDFKETDSHYLLSFDLPGVSKDDIRLSVHDHQLYVSGERREERAKEGARGLARERYYGAFQRSFTLPSAVDSDKIEANYSDGVLYLTIPKVEGAKAKQIKVVEGRPRLVEKKAA